jgi:hypothetical protein
MGRIRFSSFLEQFLPAFASVGMSLWGYVNHLKVQAVWITSRFNLLPFPIHVGNRKHPERNQIDARHEFGDERRQELLVPAS